MTEKQEEQKRKEYRKRIADGLRQGTTEGYDALCALCEEETCLFLSSRDKELTLFRRIMRIWSLERARSASETIIGRTAAFLEVPMTEVTLKQLIDVYTILKFAFFRLEADLPEELQIEGVARVLALGLTPGAILLTAEYEAEDKGQALGRFLDCLGVPAIRDTYPRVEMTAAVLRGAMDATAEKQAASGDG